MNFFFVYIKNIRLFDIEFDVLKDWKRCEFAFFERRSFVRRAKKWFILPRGQNDHISRL